MRKIVNFRPVLAIVLALISGIIFAFAIFKKDLVTAIFIAAAFLCIAVVFGVFSSSELKAKGRTIFIFVCVSVAVLGGVRFYFTVNSYKDADLGNRYLTISGKVKERGDINGGEYAVIKEVEFRGGVTGKTDYNIAVYLSGYKGLNVGNVVEFSAVIRDRAVFYEERFAASAITEKVKYFAYCSASDISVTGNNPNVLERVNLAFYDTLKAGLSGDEFATAYALITGNSDYMTEDVLYSYRSAGVAHIFAVSGLHVGFLAAVVAFILKKCKANKYFSYAITLFFCFIYSGICGFTASSLRAAIMFAVLGFAPITNKRYDGLSSVAFAAFMILVFSPTQLFCAGFQLSFAVVLSLTLILKPLSAILKKMFKFLPQKVCSAVSACIASQVAGIPICLYFFGNFSLIAIFMNMLLLPIIGVVFIFLLICLLLSLIGAPTVFLFLPSFILKALRFAITAIDYKGFLVGGFTLGGFAVCYYSAIIISSGIINLKKLTKIILSVVLSAICILGTAVKTVREYDSLKISVLATENFCACIVSEKETNIIVVSNIDYIFSSVKLKRLAERKGVKEADVVILNQGENVDLQVAVSKLCGAITVKSLLYYGEKDETQESILNEAFPEILCANYKGGNMIIGNVRYETVNDGKCFVTKQGENVIAIYSVLAENSFNIPYNPTAVICYDKADYINAEYSPKCIITYLNSGSFESAYASGCVTICFN